jgi:hypothetical protein
MKEVQKSSNSVCYTPSSEPFRIHIYVVQMFFCFSWGGERLSSRDKSAALEPIVPSPDGRWWSVWGSWWNAKWGYRSTWKKPAEVTLCPPRIQRRLMRYETQVPVVGILQLTASAMAQPVSMFQNMNVIFHLGLAVVTFRLWRHYMFSFLVQEHQCLFLQAPLPVSLWLGSRSAVEHRSDTVHRYLQGTNRIELWLWSLAHMEWTSS